MQSCAEWTGQHGTSSCLYNHEGFNSLTETEKEKLFAFILRPIRAAVRALAPRERVWCASRALATTCAPNTLSARANEAFKIIVSCLTVWWIGQASTGLVYFKNGCQLWWSFPVLWRHFWFCRSSVLKAVVTSAVHSYTDTYSSRCFNLLNK